MFKSLHTLNSSLGPTVDTYTIQDQEDNYNSHAGTDAEMMTIIKDHGGSWLMTNNRTGLASIIRYNIGA